VCDTGIVRALASASSASALGDISIGDAIITDTFGRSTSAGDLGDYGSDGTDDYVVVTHASDATDPAIDNNRFIHDEDSTLPSGASGENWHLNFSGTYSSGSAIFCDSGHVEDNANSAAGNGNGVDDGSTIEEARPSAAYWNPSLAADQAI
jgi:hypothetical protein